MYVELSIDFGNPGYKAFTKEQFKNLVLETVASLGIYEVPIVEFHNKGPIGECSFRVGSPMNYNDDIYDSIYMQQYDSEFSTPSNTAVLCFNTELLNGQDYTLSQIDETIRHEIAHVVAFRKYKTDCGHDFRWIKIAKSFGCSGSELLSSGEAFYDINPVPINDGKVRTSKYYVYCRKR